MDGHAAHAQLDAGPDHQGGLALEADPTLQPSGIRRVRHRLSVMRSMRVNLSRKAHITKVGPPRKAQRRLQAALRGAAGSGAVLQEADLAIGDPPREGRALSMPSAR